MPNPGTFLGPRGDFLREQGELYTQAVQDGDINSVVSDIQHRYLKRWPITLPHNVEQTQEWLENVDDDAPDEDISAPNVNGMSPEDAAKAMDDFNVLMKRLKGRKEAIKRRMHYMYSKSKEATPLSSGKNANDPMTILMGRLTGVDFKMPRLKTGYNLWGPQNRDIVDPVFKQRVEAEKVPTNQQLALRSSVYKELFEQLAPEKQAEWTQTAVREHEKAVCELRKRMENEVSTKPEDRQRVINNLAKIAEPILDLIVDLTGWKASLVVGGPEPADGGRLNMIWIHSGVQPGSVKMDFGRAERLAFKESITPAFGSYLKRCYPIDVCRSMALSKDHGMATLTDSTVSGNVEIHRFLVDKEHAEASKSHKRRRLLEKEFPQTSKGKKIPNPPPTGTPSPQVRFGPPIGKKKNRELPSKDKPKTLMAPVNSSPLAQTIVAAAPVSFSASVASSQPVAAGPSQPVAVGPSRVASPAPSHPASPAPSRPALTVPSRPASTVPSHPASVAPSRPTTPVPSRPATPFPSRPASAVPSRPNTPAPSCPATPAPSRPTSPAPSQPVTPAPSRPASPAPSRSEPAAPSHSASPTPSHHISPTSVTLAAAVTAPSQPIAQDSSRPASPTPSTTDDKPSGTATVPDFSSITNASTSHAEQKGKHGDTHRALIATRQGAGKRKATGVESSTSKRQRTGWSAASKSDSDTRAFTLDVPSACMPWARDALELLAAQDLGPQWQELVNAWLSFEATAGFVKQAGQLPSKGRSPIMGEWIKRARPPQCPDDLGDIDAFKGSFHVWWRSFQPKWRVGGASGGLIRSGSDWGALRQYSGVNGLLSILACLFFWGLTSLTPAQRSLWDDAVDDVLYVMQQLAVAV